MPVVVGLMLMTIALVGVLRMPATYSKLHAQGLATGPGSASATRRRAARAEGADPLRRLSALGGTLGGGVPGSLVGGVVDVWSTRGAPFGSAPDHRPLAPLLHSVPATKR